MTFSRRLLLLIPLALILGLPLGRAAGPYGSAAANKRYAQVLVTQMLAANPDLLTVGFHCVPPGSQTQTIVASTLNVIGKPSDPPDVGVGAHGETIISPNLKVPKLGIMLPLHDRTGKRIGALALAFKFRAGDDQVAVLARATALRDALAQKIPGLDELFAASR